MNSYFMYIKKTLIITLFFVVAVNSYPFRLENIYFNQRIDGKNGGSREFYLINNSEKNEENYKIRVIKSENGVDISKYVKISPKIVTVYPNSRETIKVSVKVPQNFKNGNYPFVLEFAPIKKPVLPKVQITKSVGTVNIGIAPLLEVSGYTGDINFEKSIKFDDVKIVKKGNGIELTAFISNTSYARVDVAIELYGKDGYLYGGNILGELAPNLNKKKIVKKFDFIANPNLIKEIHLMRVVSDEIEILKVIKLNDND